jgi:glycerol transport system ATP-binding protein
MPGRISGNEVSFASDVHFPLNVDLRPIGEGEFRFGVRPSHISLVPSNDDDLELAVTVEVAEISGSETFLHVRSEHFFAGFTPAGSPRVRRGCADPHLYSDP